MLRWKRGLLVHGIAEEQKLVRINQDKIFKMIN